MIHNPKILIINQVCQLNMGDASILNGTIKLLKEIFSKAHFTILSFNPTIDEKKCDVKVIRSIRLSIKSLPRVFSLILRILLWKVLQRISHLNNRILLNDSLLQHYANSDIVIVRGGDSLTKDYGYPSLASHLLSILFAKLMQKPIILLGHTIGFFGLLKYIAKNILDKVDLILLREKLSRQYLYHSGIFKPPIYVTADLSLHLNKPDVKVMDKMLHNEGIDIKTKIVGVSVSQICAQFLKHPKKLREKRKKYLEIMVRMIDYLVDNFNVDIIHIPYVLGPGNNDDRIISKAIYSKTHSPKRVKLVVNEYRPEELNGIIRHCEIFIGARMHACLAALMNGVPTVALGYGHKFDGVIGGMFGQERYVLPVEKLNWEDLRLKIDEVWESKGKIRKDLKIKNRDVRKKVKRNYIILRNFLNLK